MKEQVKSMTREEALDATFIHIRDAKNMVYGLQAILPIASQSEVLCRTLAEEAQSLVKRVKQLEEVYYEERDGKKIPVITDKSHPFYGQPVKFIRQEGEMVEVEIRFSSFRGWVEEKSLEWK